MTHLSLYRKWRPKVFAEVVGQEPATRTLQNALKEGRLAHVYLFAGSRGTGKTSVAKILSRAVNCEKGPAPEPCNQCPACTGIADGKAMDVLEIDAASNRGIDEIRELRDKIYFQPTSCRYKVYIIDEVHMLTNEAFNALLKMLEEPPGHALFILATTEPHKLPLTVVSRCQRFDFAPLKVADVEKRLKEIAKAEGIKAEPGALSFIALYAKGSLRDAVGVLDQISSFTRGKIKAEDVKSLLGVMDTELFVTAADIIAAGKSAEVFVFVHELVADGRDLAQFIKGLIEHFRNLFVMRESTKWEEVIEVAPDTVKVLEKQKERFDSDRLVELIEVLSGAFKRAKSLAEPRFVLETTLLELAQGTSVSRRSVVARIEALERKLQSTEAPAGHDGDRAREPVRRPAKEKTAPSPASGDAGKRAKEDPKRPAGEDRRKQKPEPAGAVTPEKEVRAAGQAPSRKAGAGRERGAAPQVKKPGPSSASLDRVERAWQLVVDGVKKKKISTYALLLECRPGRVSGGVLTLEFNEGAEFHRAETEKQQNREIVEAVLAEVLGEKLRIKCTGQPGGPGEPAVSEAQSAVNKNRSSVADRNRPVSEGEFDEMVKTIFGAEVVEETPVEEGKREG